MTVKTLWFAVLGTLLLVGGCRSHAHSNEGDHGDHDGEGHGDHADTSQSYTGFTDNTELFLEYPSLVVGQESPFAAHLTGLSDFRAIAAGRLTAVLSGGSAPEERFTVDAPSVAGIFRPVVKPSHAGKRRLTLEFESSDMKSTHDLGEVTVFENQPAAETAAATSPEAEGGSISFLKEQQWKVPFATADVAEHTLRPSVSAYGVLRARADGEATVTSPRTGRLITISTPFPRIGMEVKRDQVLAVLSPSLGSEKDTASLDLAVSRAQLSVDHARKERERLEGLLAQGAIPERRVAVARLEDKRAQAELTAATRQRQRYNRVQRTSGGHDGGIEIRSPLVGTVVAVESAPGAFVREGQRLFRIMDLNRLWLEASVPEANVGRLGDIQGAWFEIDGFDAPFEIDESGLVATGGVLDPQSKTLPVIFEVGNEERRLRGGLTVTTHLLTGVPVVGVAIPRAAVINDGGQPVAFVMVDGESFERRTLDIGIEDGELVQVLGGLQRGDRVVTRGAYLVKLAASATSLPAHGHGH